MEGHPAPWQAFRAKEFLTANLIRPAQRIHFIESSGSCLQIFMLSLCNPYAHFHLLIGSGNDFAAGGRQRQTPQAQRSRSTSNPRLTILRFNGRGFGRIPFFLLFTAIMSVQSFRGQESSAAVAGQPILLNALPDQGDDGDPWQTDAAHSTPGTASLPQRGFFTRLGHAYLDDWTVDSNGAAPSPEPARRGTPRPLNSPPFPSADWPIGGTVVVGAPDYGSYPLMQAINENKSRFKIYGWFDIGGNASTSNKGRYANNETAYDVIPNSIQLDQVALYFERLPNTVQTEHVDWGFRFTSIYGLDYRYTTAKGIFSQQLLKDNNTYGYDPVMYYLDFYVPQIAKGMDVRIGRYISLPDIEAQLAPNNYTYSHSILYTYDCYTQNGINTTTKLNGHWTVQAGVSGGCESAPWISNAKLTGDFCAAYTWKDGGDNFYACANSVNSGKYAYNNLSAYYLTWYHKINPTWHTDTEAWYQYERDVPNLCYGLSPCISYGSNANIGANAGEITGPSLITGANGAQCNPLATHCFAPDYAIVNYIEHEFNHHHSSFSIRNEYFDDLKGQRTGNKTRYSEHLVGFNFWLGSTVTFRPELRFEHSYDVPAYDSPSVAGVSGAPTKTTQLTLAGDVIYHF
jgi:Putative beta-barrel porin-2, OmpL-like. bbp2